MDDSTPTTIKEKKEKEDGVSMVYIVLLILWMIIAFIYAINNRSLEEFIKYGSYIFRAFLSITVLLFIVYAITNIRRGLEWRIILLLVILLPIGFTVASAEYYSIFVILKDIFLWIKSPSFSGNGKIICTVLLTLSLGLALFYFRLKLRACYGFTEAVVGLIVATHRVPTQAEDIKNPEFYLAILTASLFLVVRGFDNIHQGLTKKPKDPWAHKFYLFLKRKT